jgi:rhodanese-related sulfurtransferase
MGRWIASLSVNQKLALVTFVLGAVALFATPYHGNVVTLDAKELALVVARNLDRVEPLDLAAWIVETRADYRLIDVRDAAAYQQYHIPTADHVPMPALTDAGLRRHEKVVLYSDGSTDAAQAWMLLRAQGYKGVYILNGGLDAWKAQVLFPVLAETPDADRRVRDAKAASLAAFFGGQARVGNAAASASTAAYALASPALPTVVPPASPAGGGKSATKKKREGC